MSVEFNTISTAIGPKDTSTQAGASASPEKPGQHGLASPSPTLPILNDPQSINGNPTVEILNEFLADAQAEDLEFTIDQTTGTSIVKIIDTRTNEIVRQFPQEELLRIKASIRESLATDTQLHGLLLDEEA